MSGKAAYETLRKALRKSRELLLKTTLKDFNKNPNPWKHNRKTWEEAEDFWKVPFFVRIAFVYEAPGALGMETAWFA